MSDYDVVVCGGGPSGATTAFYAARAGLRMSGVRITPELWAEVQVIEGAAVAAMRES